MTESISYLGLITALFLPWLLGSIACYGLLSRSGHWNIFIVLGQGYLIGIFLTTLALRFWSYVGLPLHFWAIALTLLGLSVAGFFAMRARAAPIRTVSRTPPMKTWQIAVAALLLLLIAYRYTCIAQEIALRPLFPWDAWMNWSPKAGAWFYNNELTPFVSPRMWLNQTGDSLNYTTGARGAWKYPPTIPLIQFWGMIGAGTHDYNPVYLPWIMVILALGLALYGHLRLAGSSVLLSILACYLLLNLPFLNVQTALAGYADTWVAAAFGAAVFSLHQWGENRHWSYALLALALALMCTQLKIPGLIMGGIVLTVFLTSIIKLGKKSCTSLLLGFAAVAVYIAAVGVDFSIPAIGRVAVSKGGITLPYIGVYELSYHPIHDAMINTTLLMINWNLLWYLLIFVALLRVANGTVFKTPSLALRSVLLTLFFIFFVYYFTNRYVFAINYTQVNRALIYVIPPLVFYLVYTCFTLSGPGLTTKAVLVGKDSARRST
jgi:hypothetical protein